jgi:hypothetical protein
MIKNSTKSMTFYGKNFNPLTFGTVGMKAGLSAANNFTGGLDKMASVMVDGIIDKQLHGIKGAKLGEMALDQPERSANFALADFYKKYGITAAPEMAGYIGDGLTGKIAGWEWQNYFKENTWREKIMPHLLKEQFKDVLASVQNGIIDQYKNSPDKAQMKEVLAQATKELADMFHDYTLDLANNTEALDAPINFLPDPQRQARERYEIQSNPDILLEDKAKILKDMDLAEPVFTEKELEQFTNARIKGTPYKSNLGPLQTKQMTKLGIKQDAEAQKKAQEEAASKDAEAKAKAEEERKKAEAELEEKEKEALGNAMNELEEDLFDSDRNEGLAPEKAQPKQTETPADAVDEEVDLGEWDQEIDKSSFQTTLSKALPKWQQKMFGYAPRVERGYISSMTNGLYQYVASAGYEWAGKTAQSTMKRMAKAAYDPMNLAGMNFNQLTVGGRVKGTVLRRYADTVSEYIKSFGNPEGPFFVTGDAVAKEAFETYDFDEKKRNDFYNELGFEFDSTAVLKGIADDIRNWEDKDQFYDKNWREEIIPHILRTSFQRELDKVQKTILEKYGQEGLNNRAALEYKLEMGTRMLAFMYQDYSNQLAEKTGLLEMPLFCADKKNVLNSEELKDLLGAKKYAEFKKKFESAPPLINEKKIRETVNRAMGQYKRRPSEEIGQQMAENLKKAKEKSKAYDPAVLMKAVSDVRELEARCAKTGFFGRNLPFFNRSYQRTMALKESLKEQIRGYVDSREPKPEVVLENLFDLKYPFETDGRMSRQMEGREFRPEFPQKSFMEKTKDVVASVAKTTVETVKSVANVAVEGAKMVYNVVTSEGGQKVMAKVVDTVVDAGLNTMKTVADYTVDAGIKIANMTATGIEKVGNVVADVVQTVTDTVSTVTENVTNTVTNIATGTVNVIQTGAGYVTGTVQYGMDMVSTGLDWLFGGSDPIEENPEEELSLMSDEEAKEIDETFVEKVKEDGGLEAVQKAVPDPEVLKEIAPEVAKEIEKTIDKPGPEQDAPGKTIDQGAPEHEIYVDPETGEKIIFSEIPEEPTQGPTVQEVEKPAQEPTLDQVPDNTGASLNDYEYDEDDSVYEEAYDNLEDLIATTAKPDPVTEKREALERSISDFRKSLEEKQSQLRESLRTIQASEAPKPLAGIIVISTINQAVSGTEQKLSEVNPLLSDEEKLAEYGKIEKDLNKYQRQMEEPEYGKNVQKLNSDPHLRLALTEMGAKNVKLREKLNMLADSKTVTEQYVNAYRTRVKNAMEKKKEAAPPVKTEPQKEMTTPTIGGLAP